MKNNIQKPLTAQQAKAAIVAQAPVALSAPVDTTKQLAYAKLVQSAVPVSGVQREYSQDIVEWKQKHFFFGVATDEQITINAVSRSFVILRAWNFESENYGSRIGIEVVVDSGDVYCTSLPLDAARADLIKTFEKSSAPIGPCQFHAIESKYGRPYIALEDWTPSQIAEEPDAARPF